MQKCIKSIEDPAKVAAIQRFFGVSYNRRAPVKRSPENEYSKEESINMIRRISTTNSPADIVKGPTNRDNASLNDVSAKNATNHVEVGSTNESSRTESKNYTVQYKYWYYFFISVTYLGDVIGYAFVLPFLFWNVDGVIARKLVLVWTAIMYIGQAVKEVVRRGRPECPPVIRLQKRWSEEYGMPSTHAMAAVSVPASLLFYGNQRYEFHVAWGIVISLVWCVLISFSRLYLGMHSILDVIAGFLLSLMLLIPLLPMMDITGENVVEYSWSPFVIVVASLIFIVIYPKARGLTTAHTKTDTTIILATCVGVEIGCWLNYQLSLVQKSSSAFPYLVNAPDWREMSFIVSRTVLGLICIVVSFIIFELVTKFTYWILSKTKGSHIEISSTSQKIPIVDLCLKYLTYCITSLHVTFSIPLLFKQLGIHRSSYFTE